MNISVSCINDTGRHRDQNEDDFTFCPDLSRPEWGKSEAVAELGSYGCLLAVADGMGGANAGEVASAKAMEIVRQKFSDPANLATVVTSQSFITQKLLSTVEEADAAIKQYANDNANAYGLGTTLVLCWIVEQKAYVAWCGDSRCYLFNSQIGLMPLTKDHSYVQELVDHGELTEMEAFNHPNNNVITRALGDVGAKASPDFAIHKIQEGDMLMLCTDGLCGYCTDLVMEKVISDNYPSASRCCNRLLQLALGTGGYDNICIITASFGSSPMHTNGFFKSLFVTN